MTEAPKIINLGSGKDWREDCLNVDILARTSPDLCLDICSPIVWGSTVFAKRFAPFPLNKGMFEKIIANDVLEHLVDLTTAMKTCVDFLCDGGEFHICVPYDLSYGAWQDPTHVRAFNERSWWYYSDWAWYLGWTESRFLVASLNFNFSEYGNQLQAKLMDHDSIIKTPRAVDSMSVVLKKITMEKKND